MTHDANGNGKVDRPQECLFPDYFKGNVGSDFAKIFAIARKNNRYTPQMELSIGETLKAKIGLSVDPVHGAYQWSGGNLAERINANKTNKYINKTFVVIKLNSNSKVVTYKHLFYGYQE